MSLMDAAGARTARPGSPKDDVYAEFAPRMFSELFDVSLATN
jgi:hypothetical protein